MFGAAVKHACAFGHHDKHCLICLSTFKNIVRLSQAKDVLQAHVCVMAKPANTVLDRQNFKCLPNNACPFGKGFVRTPCVYSYN